MNEKQMTIALFISIILLCGVVSLYNASGARQDVISSARMAVEAQGYENVQYIQNDPTGCGENSGYIFDADNANGNRVRITACSPNGDPWRGNWYIVTKWK